MSLQQYISRDVDLAFWKADWEREGVQSVQFELQSLITTGTYKVLQQVISLFLTSQGSKSLLPEEGSPFLDHLYKATYDEELLISIAQISLDEIKNSLNETANEEEQIETLTIDELNYQAGTLSVTLTLKLVNEDQVIVPLRVTLK